MKIRALQAALSASAAAGRLGFRLESGEGFGDQGGTSYYGAEPRAVFVSRGRVSRIEAEGKRRTVCGDPFDALRQFLDRWLPRGKHARTPAAVAALSYDLGRAIERIPRIAEDDNRFPDAYVAVYGRIAALDHSTGDVRLLDSSDSTWLPIPPGIPSPHDFHARPGPANLTRAGYVRAVRRAVDLICAGDIFQVNLSRRFSARVTGAPAELHARLRAASPAPFSAWLDLGTGRHVFSTSPERFLRIDGRRIETRPIKGTRPRGATPASDAALRRDLERSEKDRAELAMIVDLERNDLGRVCRVGSVKVAEARAIERFPQVFHGVATVTGELGRGIDLVDTLRATFPGGSITGAPKIRAMEIIEELEPTRRGLYTGAIGWLARDACDLSIAIRTVLLDGERATWQVGAGITAESDPEEEERETRAKAKGIERALGFGK